MRIALVSDEVHPIHDDVQAWLAARGYQTVRYGALRTRADVDWAPAAREGARAVASGLCDEGIFFCWTGTGISMAANKLPGIRAALCTDAETAAGARVWNHANVLCLSNHTLTPDLAHGVLAAWFEAFDTKIGAAGVRLL